MKISVLGLGAYGIAIAKAFYENDNKISMWSKFEDEVKTVLLKRENKRLLPGVKIPKDIVITSNMEECIQKSKLIVIAVPITAVRDVAKELAKYVTEDQVICITTKGIDPETNKFMDEIVFEETKNNNICMLSGPSFAADLAMKNEQGFTVASKVVSANLTVKVCLENEHIFVNQTKDIQGVEICAAVKNVFAILLGMIDGLKLSDSTRASILTCVINDLRFISEMLGGKALTIFSYAGIGDLLLTTMSSKSRNYMLGKNISEGMNLKDALKSMDVTTVEGVYTLKAIKSILDKKELTVKSINLMYNILYKDERVEDILRYIHN
jgi:glycerol-3-phosphate dehydrogenase (NAD(P)+)